MSRTLADEACKADSQILNKDGAVDQAPEMSDGL